MAKSSTTRRAVLSSAIAAAALPAFGSAADSGKPLLQPTELGREMLRLFPAFAEACWFGIHSYDADDPTVDAWEKRTRAPLDELADKATNVIDLAIAHCIFHECDHFDDESPNKLTEAVLALAGIALEACSVSACIKKRWGEREPTEAETREALARVA